MLFRARRADIGGVLPHQRKSDVKPSVVNQRESHFSWLRTRLSTERTLMSWVRTSTALIGFGFTLAQFFEGLSKMAGVAPPRHPGLIRLVALSLIAIGVLALATSIREYRAMIRYLWSDDFRDIAGIGDAPRATPALSVAVLLACVGVLTLVTIVIRSATR